jgi:hypothetical protein
MATYSVEPTIDAGHRPIACCEPRRSATTGRGRGPRWGQTSTYRFAAVKRNAGVQVDVNVDVRRRRPRRPGSIRCWRRPPAGSIANPTASARSRSPAARSISRVETPPTLPHLSRIAAMRSGSTLVNVGHPCNMTV